MFCLECVIFEFFFFFFFFFSVMLEILRFLLLDCDYENVCFFVVVVVSCRRIPHTGAERISMAVALKSTEKQRGTHVKRNEFDS